MSIWCAVSRNIDTNRMFTTMDYLAIVFLVFIPISAIRFGYATQSHLPALHPLPDRGGGYAKFHARRGTADRFAAHAVAAAQKSGRFARRAVAGPVRTDGTTDRRRGGLSALCPPRLAGTGRRKTGHPCAAGPEPRFAAPGNDAHHRPPGQPPAGILQYPLPRNHRQYARTAPGRRRGRRGRGQYRYWYRFLQRAFDRRPLERDRHPCPVH